MTLPRVCCNHPEMHCLYLSVMKSLCKHLKRERGGGGEGEMGQCCGKSSSTPLGDLKDSGNL